jgi:hypothetical protein
MFASWQPLPQVAHRRFTYHALRINGEPESYFKRRAELTAALRWVPVPNFTRKAELVASVDIIAIGRRPSDELGMGQDR